MAELSYQNIVSQYDHAPQPSSCTCIHCGGTFTGKNALQKMRNHLRFCKKRANLRHIKHQGYVWVLTLNPSKKLGITLNNFVQEKDPSEVPQLVIGALMVLKKLGQIRNFTPIDIKNSPDFTKLPNGVLSYKAIFGSLSDEDKVRFGEFCQNVYENRLKEV